MTGRRIDLQDLLFGLFLVGVAAFTTVATWSLRVGTAANMGPGYMPRAIAALVCAFGLFFVGRGLVSPFKSIAPPQPRAVIFILAAVAAFAVLVTTAGLMIASVVTIVIAGFASREMRVVETVLFGSAMAVGAVLVFVQALKLPVPIWPW
ncbi:MAG: tripartite tricarboxylate transporter TctB family protein [Rhodoplanes sp.]|uniref:tripartite tricarboxylate transporter TctB family protein n=1 Tax=Rhodoplanes sp. TaxID=1968906 RepID=UPI00178EE5DA|nr:tripartite tricarboxylate transporter TctB family protein [Rhodoplanes sp.]NVO12921.1 tripartite tricarboxylate transporter TctB family protein [Rhodoplanes sp.]